MDFLEAMREILRKEGSVSSAVIDPSVDELIPGWANSGPVLEGCCPGHRSNGTRLCLDFYEERLWEDRLAK